MMGEHRVIVSDRWLQAAIDGGRQLVVSPSVEHSPKPEGQGSDIYLCGECEAVLTRRPRGVPLGHSILHCPTCGSLNEA
jgi:hypothetical protein